MVRCTRRWALRVLLWATCAQVARLQARSMAVSVKTTGRTAAGATEASIAAAFVQEIRHKPPLTPEEGHYTNEPKLARSFKTTSWLDNDMLRVKTVRDLDDGPIKLKETLSQPHVLVGNESELTDQTYLTRHGLYRRTDAKFDEFVARPTATGKDGYGLWRVWESHGGCPTELLIADPWGSVTWEAAGGTLRRKACSWVVRPGMYRHEGYFKVSRAPIAITFRTFNLAADVEALDVYDGAHMDATLLGRFSGVSLPPQIAATGAEVRLVLRSGLHRSPNATVVWQQVEAAISHGLLHEAQRKFIEAARYRLVGFYKQDMRRVIRGLATRMSVRPEHAWMRARWFAADGDGFERVYNGSLISVLEGMSGWAKRSAQQEGKEDVAWETVSSMRRYPQAVNSPELNPYYDGKTERRSGSEAHVHAEPLVELDRYLGHSPQEPSGFSLDFTTTADCSGRGIAPYGDGVFPPQTVSSNPESNYEFLPFPIEVSSCQPMLITGAQTTRNRPFTIADTVMKRAQEDELKACLDPTECPVRTDIEGVASNCTVGCNVFLRCVSHAMANRSLYLSPLGPKVYNKSLTAQAREECLALPEAEQCLNINPPPEGTDEAPGVYSREEPKSAGCLNLHCLHCGPRIYDTYAQCASICGANLETPSPLCIDCSYSFQDRYEQIDELREKVWFSYLSGALGFRNCPMCDLNSNGMMRADVPMSSACRRCHYAIEDLINPDVFECLHRGGGVANTACYALNRGGYNFEQDIWGVIKEGVSVDLSDAGIVAPPPPPP